MRAPWQVEAAGRAGAACQRGETGAACRAGPPGQVAAGRRAGAPAWPRFFRTVIDALAGLGGELQAVVAAPPGEQAPPHILFAGHVPQLALLPHMSAVVCHGGQNTVCEALAYGLPLVLTPIRDD